VIAGLHEAADARPSRPAERLARHLDDCTTDAHATGKSPSIDGVGVK
jgi:hypothetical protein